MATDLQTDIKIEVDDSNMAVEVFKIMVEWRKLFFEASPLKRKF